MSDTPALVVCDSVFGGDKPHAECRYCENPRPAATLDLPTSSAPQIEGRCLVRVFEGDHWGAVYRACNAKIPCAAHPAPPEGTQGKKLDGVALIAAERKRQIEKEGWTQEHDDQHNNEALALAAVCYATPEWLRDYKRGIPVRWPWSSKWWKPRPDSRVRELVKAGALIAAEIDRLQS